MVIVAVACIYLCVQRTMSCATRRIGLTLTVALTVAVRVGTTVLVIVTVVVGVTVTVAIDCEGLSIDLSFIHIVQDSHRS